MNHLKSTEETTIWNTRKQVIHKGPRLNGTLVERLGLIALNRTHALVLYLSDQHFNIKFISDMCLEGLIYSFESNTWTQPILNEPCLFRFERYATASEFLEWEAPTWSSITIRGVHYFEKSRQ